MARNESLAEPVAPGGANGMDHDTGKASGTRRWQFGLRRLIVLVTIAAAILAVFRWCEWPLSSAFVCIALLAAGVQLSSRPRNTFAAIMIFMYVPYAWLIWDHNPWTDTRWDWIGMWPVLPGLVPGAILFHPNDVIEFAVMAVVTLLFAAAAGYAATRGRRWFVATALVVFVASVLNSFVAYALYRA